MGPCLPRCELGNFSIIRCLPPGKISPAHFAADRESAIASELPESFQDARNGRGETCQKKIGRGLGNRPLLCYNCTCTRKRSRVGGVRWLWISTFASSAPLRDVPDLEGWHHAEARRSRRRRQGAEKKVISSVTKRESRFWILGAKVNQKEMNQVAVSGGESSGCENRYDPKQGQTGRNQESLNHESKP
jgi:hypothetical protein